MSTRAFISFQLVTRVLPHHFLPGFFFVITEILRKVVFFATIGKLNGQNNCIKSFPFSRYKEKQVSLLVALRKDSNLSSQKKKIKCKTFFSCGASNTEELFDFFRKVKLQHTVI